MHIFSNHRPPIAATRPRGAALSRPVPSRPIPSGPVPSRTAPSRPVPSRPIPMAVPAPHGLHSGSQRVMGGVGR